MHRRLVSRLPWRSLHWLLLALLPAASGCDAFLPAAGTNLLAGARWEYSADRGKTWDARPVVVPGGKAMAVYARTTFEVDDPSPFATLEFTPGAPPRQRQLYYLNGELLRAPMRGMYYKTIPAIPPERLKSGTNELTAKIGIDNRPPARYPDMKMPPVVLRLKTRLAGLECKHLRIHSGPVLGAFGDDYFTVTCRTNMPVPVKLLVAELDPAGRPGAGSTPRQVVSPAGLIHRFRVDKPTSVTEVEYRLEAGCGDSTISTEAYRARLPSFAAGGGRDRTLRIVAMGDSRTNTAQWARVAAAVTRERPDLVVFSGDMVGRGRDDWRWEEHYFGPAREFFATIPHYPVIGNHEEKAPLYPLLFYTPGADGLATNWSQQIGDVLLIGIEGRDDWSPYSENVQWLDGVLSAARARFVFFFSHYPAWTTGKHGELDGDTGLPAEYEVLASQYVIVPLLRKHKVTAMIVGHDHMYERSELPGGLTHIISGGAGAPLRGQSRQAEEQNPHSKVCRTRLHYCILEVKGDTCTMKAVGLDGKVFDTRTWKARQVDGSDSHAPAEGDQSRRRAVPPAVSAAAVQPAR